MRQLRLLGLSLIFATVGGLVGYLVLPERAPAEALVPSIRVLGRHVAPGGNAQAKATAIARAFLREHMVISAQATVTDQQGEVFAQHEEARNIDRTREALGARVDVGILASMIAAANDPSSPLRMHHEALAKGRPIDLPM